MTQIAYPDRNETMRQALSRVIASMTGTTTTLREFLAAIGDHGPLLLSALLCVPFLIPVSIPGVSTVFALAILMLAIGVTLNRTPWLPRQILDRGIDAQKLRRVLQRGDTILAKLETFTRQRISFLTNGALAGRVNGLAIIAGAFLLMLPLGLVPFSNTLPAIAILLLALGASQRDGALVIGGYVMLLATCVYFSILAYLAFIAGTGVASMFSGS